MRRPVVTVTIRNEQGDVLHSEKRSAFNAGIRASEDAIREIARAAHTTYEADRPSRVGDVYTRRWVSRDGRAIVATIEKEPETAMEARKTSPEPDPVEAAHKAGAGYAHEQIGSPYFLEWVHEQMAEAERMRQADPNSVIDASTPAGARKVAKNMLQQLEWDTKRELNMTTVGLEHGDAKAFYEGFAEQLRQTSTVEWLTDIILRTEEDMRGGRRSKLSTTQEAGRYGRRRYGDSDAVIKHKQYEEEWQRKSAEYRAKVEPLKAGLVKINGQDLRSRGLQIPSRDDEILIASLSDPRKGNEPVAHFWQYPGFGYGEDGGLGQTYFVDPAIVPAGKEAREARRGSRGKKTFEAYALEVEQALVASGVRPGQAAVWTSNHGAFIDKELKDGASANDTAERILESERESSIPYGRESRRPVAPYYSKR